MEQQQKQSRHMIVTGLSVVEGGFVEVTAEITGTGEHAMYVVACRDAPHIGHGVLVSIDPSEEVRWR